MGASAIHESGHFYFAQTGHSHFAATRLNALLSEQTLNRKILRRIVLLSWAQEVWSSNLHAPTTYFFIFNSLL
jgi:hypothetical protein